MRGFFRNTPSTHAGGQPTTGTAGTDQVARFPLRIALPAILLGTAVGALLAPASQGIDGDTNSVVSPRVVPIEHRSAPAELGAGESTPDVTPVGT